MNSNSLVIKQKQQTNKETKTYEFQNSTVRLSFLYRTADIKIVWINP